MRFDPEQLARIADAQKTFNEQARIERNQQIIDDLVDDISEAINLGRGGI